MNFPLFVAKRITQKGHRTFSKLIVRVSIGAMALAVVAILLSVAILQGFKEEITAKQRGFFSDIIITKNQLNGTENSPIELSKSDLDRIVNLENVESISPFATKVGIMNVHGEVEGVVLKGISSDYNQKFLTDILVEGNALYFNAEHEDSELLISAYLADRLKLKVNDTFIMSFVQDNRTRKRKFKVVGIFRTNSEELDHNYVIGSLDLIRRLNNLQEDQAGAYEVRVKDFSQLAITTQLVADELPMDLKATNVVEYLSDIFNWLEMLDMNDDIIFVLMVIVAIINMISSLLISILERTKMIGVLKALGMGNRALRKIFIYNSLYLIGYGLLIGNIIAIGTYILQKTTQVFKLDPTIYYIEYVPLSIDIWTVFILNVSIVGIAIISLIIPSMLISRISPIKTIQFQ